ncbi:hypothetical protein LCGC14_0311080 [marine sediment metagenome]|uniref:Uncharacterized protein n=1 Tax=marine sediment metagenome TaxID=412755 RepID=A0A0F9TME3_9ZZZZ
MVELIVVVHKLGFAEERCGAYYQLLDLVREIHETMLKSVHPCYPILLRKKIEEALQDA